MKTPRIFFLMVVGAVFAGSAAHSQDAPPASRSPAATAPAAEMSAPKERRKVPDTLMFTIDELNEIKDRIAGGEITEIAKGADAVFDAESLYLSTILYYGPKDWTIWVNGVPVGPSQDFQTFQVTDISPRHVELLVPLSVQGMRPVRLEPNQTFITESGIIVEGKWP